ncbi:MAG: efflux RND transporter periplasmic adaptor subunit [Sphingopyxis sp.]|jgi:cobalt-zinc-cadmium efflux system membrane fusion protein|nr:efflux RND transporter periplasmic adaptor subunit [Sphingopyxis sp.]
MKPLQTLTTALAALALFSLGGCNLLSGGEEHGGDEHGHAEGEGEAAAEGPNGGRLLRDGDFAVEMTIFEDGVPPQFRVYPTRDGEPVDPASVNLTVILRRLGGEENRFAFTPQRTFLQGHGTVEEPHSFDVEVIAVEGGRRHRWTYASPEGRTRITAEAAREGGIEIARVGPATIGETRELYGTIALAPTARSEIRGQFPGRIVSVTRAVGDRVRRGDLLARIESSESMQVYPVYSTVSGVIAERNGNPGDVTFDRPLYVITDPAATTVEFNVFPRDLGSIRPGQRVTIQTLDGQPVGEATLSDYIPEGNRAAGTALMRATLNNRDGRYRPGMALRGMVTINAVQVPLAVRTEALQPFRDFTVVFANYGDQYEVRMLRLGRRTPEWTEVLSGIAPGTPYVTAGSFLVRADVEKSGASHDH